MARSPDSVTTCLDVAPDEEIALDTAVDPQPLPIDDGPPFRIALLGDFSGRANRGDIAAGSRARSRRPIPVDLDNLGQVLARMDVRLHLPGPDAPFHVQFECLEDFHPDALFQRVDLFQRLRLQKRQLRDRPSQPPGPAPPPAAGSLLDAIVGGAEAPARSLDPWQKTIREIVAPYLQPRPDARRAELAARIDEVMNLAMRVLLHHPDFQQLEAAWRAVDFLLRRLEIGARLQICLIDLARQELLDDLSAPDPRATDLYRLLVTDARQTIGSSPWAVIGGLYTFETRPEELCALGRLGSIAREAGAPFLTSASPRLLGCPSFATHPDPASWTETLEPEAAREWDYARSQPESRWIGLALPRFLLRAPYASDTVDLPRFEEVTAPPEPADFLWGHPAVVCIHQIADSFLRFGWNLEPRAGEIAGLPLHTYKQDGEIRMVPCAECWMTERTCGLMLDRGVMPLASIRDRDALRLVRFQSIARPDSRLLARWSYE